MFENARRFSTRIVPPALLAALAIFVASPSLGAAAAAASPPGTSYGSAWRHAGDILSKGGYELYVPVFTYHMPYAYTPALLRPYNDFPAGVGFGKGRYNERGNWEGLYVMEFADSHGKPEYEGGYAWLATWHPFANRFRAGAGVTGFITARSDYGGYTPFPEVLPLGSIGFLNLDVQCIFVPGFRNNGNVLFSWLKLSFY